MNAIYQWGEVDGKEFTERVNKYTRRSYIGKGTYFTTITKSR